jgi:hypothetical protein
LGCGRTIDSEAGLPATLFRKPAGVRRLEPFQRIYSGILASCHDPDRGELDCTDNTQDAPLDSLLDGNLWRRKRATLSSFPGGAGAAGLPQVRFHDLRHTYGSRLRAAGVGLEDRQDLLGHTGQHITTHYSQPDITRLIQAVEKIVDMETESALRLVKSDNASTTTGGNSGTG